MTDEELDALVHTLWHGEVTLATVASSADAITTLRAQLAEAEACNRGLVRLNEAIQARADRTEQRVATLEAALAAQIEVDAEICDGMQSSTMYYEAHECANAIRDQPHDRTALDRMLTEAREKALREAADELRGQGYGAAVRTILALIEKPNAR